MTSDESRKSQEAGWRQIGAGHYSGWRCGLCAKISSSMTGRRLKRVTGVKTWVCAKCAGVCK